MNIPTNERQIQERLFQAFLYKNTLFLFIDDLSRALHFDRSEHFLPLDR